MKKGVPVVFAFILLLFIGLQVAEPVTACKVVDYRVKYINQDTQYITGQGKYTWTVYQYSNNNLWIRWRVYQKTGTKYVRVAQSWIQLKKISKNTLRIKESAIDVGYVYSYKNTKLTAAKYYWRVYRPWAIANGLI